MTDCSQDFHPAVADWFQHRIGAPTPAQRQAWPAIRQGRDTLIAAPTGSGKTLAAFLVVIDRLIQQGLNGPLPEQTQVLYISPLKALANDIRLNLEQPLADISKRLLEYQLGGVAITSQTRTGDTPASERQAMVRKPPHILVTTPESLYLLITSASGRKLLSTVNTVIVDEIHALAENKRGAHLLLTLARLDALCQRRVQRIGVSATQKPLSLMARYLTGRAASECVIVDQGYQRRRDLALDVVDVPLTAIMSHETWELIYQRLVQLIEGHRTTLIFVNTRRRVERVAAALSERLGESNVGAHHGSLAKEQRLSAEQRLKQGQLKVLVATASLELGLDIGDVELVCQLGSTHRINVLLQRIGRSGHGPGRTPKGRLFPLSRDDLLECTALLWAVAQGRLDSLSLPKPPLDVLAQQIVAETVCREQTLTELHAWVQRAWLYRNLTLAELERLVTMLAQGFATRLGRRGAYVSFETATGIIRARKNARLTALLNGGAIPEQFDLDVILQPEGLMIGTLNEDFAFDTSGGDIFQLGNQAYRFLKTEGGKVLVEAAPGLAPNVPFWLGEAQGRSDQLSEAVSDLCQILDQQLAQGTAHATRYLTQTVNLPVSAAEQLAEYLAAGKHALSCLPSLQTLVFERFFDDAGDQHLVIHSRYGARLNRAWGLALRKRFCRKFNFELQASANEDAIILSLGATHSFPLAEPAGYLKAATVKNIVIQALLTAPMFPPRWRWVCNIALAVPRRHGQRKVPPQWQRSRAEDLLAVIFPDQLACFENLSGERDIPDHPLVQQAVSDCLEKFMDIAGLERLLTELGQGKIQLITRDLPAPSPLAEEIITAKAYRFLDDGEAEERRTRNVASRTRSMPFSTAITTEAISRVRQEIWPKAGDRKDSFVNE